MTATAAPQGITLLGGTGSIGASTLDVLARFPERYRLHAVSGHSRVDALLAICVRCQPRYAVLAEQRDDASVRRRFADAGFRGQLMFGAEALDRIARDPETDAVVAAIVGAAGLTATLAAARAGKRILLANKEALVMAGALFMQAVRTAGAKLLPIDSEHNAVFQCFPLDRDDRPDGRTVRRIVLTASGGPFRSTPPADLHSVTPDQACAHPNWSMGRKISVDSATMMNKGLEVIEAHWLFELPAERIEVLIHPQSIIHSMVEFSDYSVLAQLSNPDMRVPIAHALAFPDRHDSGATALDLAAIGQLTFERPDPARFRCLELAYAALRAGGTAPAVLNAANEVAVEAFLGGGLRYTAIGTVVEATLDHIGAAPVDSLERVIEADARARTIARERVRDLMGRAA